MAKFKLCGLALLASLALTIHGSEQAVHPIGYFVSTSEASEGDASGATAFFERDGVKYPAMQGMEVFPGDVVSTPAEGGVSIAFLDNNIVQLHALTQLSVDGTGAIASADSTPLILNSGHISVAARSVGDSGFAIGLGETHASFARATTVKPASLDIIVTPNGSGGYVTNVGVLAGSATLTPRAGGKPIDLSSLGIPLLTFNTTVAGVSNAPVTFQAGNLSKTQLAALRPGDASETFVKVGKTSVSIKATITNPDGSISKGTITTSLLGVVTKDSWKTTGANKFSESFTEGAGKITVKQTFTSGANLISFSGAFAGNTSSKATLKDGKNTYTGTATYNPNTGVITFTTTKGSKDGSTATFTFNPGAPGGPTQTVVVTGGTAPGTATHTTPVGAPPALTPDGRAVTQDQVPVSR